MGSVALKLGRNDPCACGSGKKYKKCCLALVDSSVNATPSTLPPADLRRLSDLARMGLYADLEVQSDTLLVDYPDCALLFQLSGLARWRQGKNALPALMRAAELLPDDAEAHRNLGNSLRAAGQIEGAIESHRRAVELKADYAEGYNDLGSALMDLGALDEAETSFRRAIALRPEFALAHGNLGNVLFLRNRIPDAVSSCRRALELDPTFAPAMVQLAEVAAARGNFEEARALLMQAIRVEPECAEAWSGLVRIKKMTSEDAAWLVGAQRIAAAALPPRREVHVRFALGKYFDDVGDYDQAFANFRRANDLLRSGWPADDRDQMSRAARRIMDSYDASWFTRVGGGDPSERPVFIVGMPRSGTTLAEQILAAHAAVFGAEELPYWNVAAARFDARSVDDEAQEVGRLATDYLAMLRHLSYDALRVVDKMPGNFLHLGLIRAALPNARIIHLQRDPVDTCLSIYFHHFGPGHTYANELHDLAHYYGEYTRLMDHWRSVMPAHLFLEVPYEGLVDDPRFWTARMLDFIGLPWDENCLNFHRTTRIVTTHSKWQARQPISNSSVGRWRRYEKFVQPLQQIADSRSR